MQDITPEWNGERVHLGPFTVDAEGYLQPRDPAISPAFTVRWRGRHVRAALQAGSAPGGYSLAIDVVAGRIPSTAATTQRPELRSRAFDLARALASQPPPGWQVGLRPDHGIGLATTQALPVPVAAADLLAGMTSFLLCLDPYLDVVDAATGTEAVAAAGTAKT